MNKVDALKLAIDGKKVRATGWHKERNLTYENNRFFIFNKDTLICDASYLTEEDWELYEEPKKLVKKKFTRWVNYYYDKSFGQLYESEQEALGALGAGPRKVHRIEFEIEVKE